MRNEIWLKSVDGEVYANSIQQERVVDRIALLEICLDPSNSLPTAKRLVAVAVATILAIALLVVAGLLFSGVLCSLVSVVAASLFFGVGAFLLGGALVGGVLTTEAVIRERLHRSQTLMWNNLCCKTAEVEQKISTASANAKSNDKTRKLGE